MSSLLLRAVQTVDEEAGQSDHDVGLRRRQRCAVSGDATASPPPAAAAAHLNNRVRTRPTSLTLSSYGDRTFAAAGPRPWNSLPVQLRNSDITYGLFRRDSSRDTFFGTHELLICVATEKHYLGLLTYLLTYTH